MNNCSEADCLPEIQVHVMMKLNHAVTGKFSLYSFMPLRITSVHLSFGHLSVSAHFHLP